MPGYNPQNHIDSVIPSTEPLISDEEIEDIRQRTDSYIVFIHRAPWTIRSEFASANAGSLQYNLTGMALGLKPACFSLKLFHSFSERSIEYLQERFAFANNTFFDPLQLEEVFAQFPTEFPEYDPSIKNTEAVVRKVDFSSQSKQDALRIGLLLGIPFNPANEYAKFQSFETKINNMLLACNGFFDVMQGRYIKPIGREAFESIPAKYHPFLERAAKIRGNIGNLSSEYFEFLQQHQPFFSSLLATCFPSLEEGGIDYLSNLKEVHYVAGTIFKSYHLSESDEKELARKKELYRRSNIQPLLRTTR